MKNKKTKIIIGIALGLIVLFIALSLIFRLDKKDNLALNLTRNKFANIDSGQYERVLKGLPLELYLNSANEEKKNLSYIFDVSLKKFIKNDNTKDSEKEISKTLTYDLKKLEVNGYYSYNNVLDEDHFITIKYNVKTDEFTCNKNDDSVIITCDELKQYTYNFITDTNSLFDELHIKITDFQD